MHHRAPLLPFAGISIARNLQIRTQRRRWYSPLCVITWRGSVHHMEGIHALCHHMEGSVHHMEGIHALCHHMEGSVHHMEGIHALCHHMKYNRTLHRNHYAHVKRSQQASIFQHRKCRISMIRKAAISIISPSACRVFPRAKCCPRGEGLYVSYGGGPCEGDGTLPSACIHISPLCPDPPMSHLLITPSPGINLPTALSFSSVQQHRIKSITDINLHFAMKTAPHHIRSDLSQVNW